MSTGQTPPERQIADAELRVLFVGNSLTYVNDLPGMVAAFAAADGRSFAQGSVAFPSFSLEDHWYGGIADVIAVEAADVVVLQQGPSSLPANQVYLREWTERLAPGIRDAGGTPALLMVWPEEARLDAFDAVRDSYAGAAEAVAGIFIPAGQTWRAGWTVDPELDFYGPDRFHPSVLGTYAAALTVYAVLYGVDPATDCPRPTGAPVAEADHAAVCQAVAMSIPGTAGSRNRTPAPFLDRDGPPNAASWRGSRPSRRRGTGPARGGRGATAPAAPRNRVQW